MYDNGGGLLVVASVQRHQLATLQIWVCRKSTRLDAGMSVHMQGVSVDGQTMLQPCAIIFRQGGIVFETHHRQEVLLFDAEADGKYLTVDSKCLLGFHSMRDQSVLPGAVQPQTFLGKLLHNLVCCGRGLQGMCPLVSVIYSIVEDAVAGAQHNPSSSLYHPLCAAASQ